MDSLHLHLITNHLPILGSFFGLLALIIALLLRSRSARIAAASILLVSGIGGMVANATGEEAEERVEHLPGFSGEVIHEHEEAAEAAMPFIIGMAVFALVQLIADFLRKEWVRFIAPILLITALCVAMMSGRAGWLGGKIRHTELDAVTVPGNGSGETEEEH